MLLIILVECLAGATPGGGGDLVQDPQLLVVVMV